MQSLIIYTSSELKAAINNKNDFIVIRGELAKKIIKYFPKRQSSSSSTKMAVIEWTPEIIMAISYLFICICVGFSTFIALYKDYTCKVRAKDVEVIFERNDHQKN